MRFVLWLVISSVCLIVTSPLLLIVKYLDMVGDSDARDRFLYWITSRGARFICRLSLAKIEIHGRENLASFPTALFAANHMSLMDAFLIHGYLGRLIAHVSVKQVKMVPVLGSWVTYFGSVFLDRTDFWLCLRCAEQAAGKLRSGRSMVVFPEGRIIYDETLGQFKAGSLQIAVRAGVPVIPVTIMGVRELFYKNLFRGFRRGRIRCVIHPPILTSGLSEKEKRELVLTVREIIAW